jgi:hypothetical protein
MQTTETKRTLPPCRHKSQQSSISERTRLVEPRRERRSQTTKRMGRPFGLNLASTGHCQGGLMKEELSRRSEIIGKKTTQTEICKQESEEDNMASRQRDRRVEIRPPSSSRGEEAQSCSDGLRAISRPSVPAPTRRTGERRPR